ncbi:hypothetical protein K1T71_010127 [Dendrolimus kikuchii]|uniref:Uncharacterized protein n=1 Tax=Dendrolimus kikuchii TaxID=765133 RepID=A0ACC1CQX2_9NEOP|nr:hypothetical protein K1T71_010127 [Dendrolimus kikuchii]
MVTSEDGFGCACEEHSIPLGVIQCKACNATEVVSSDGTMCIPRRCQNSPGKVVCRRCPADYISVTQNLDGSPLKEVQCVKCYRGYKAQANVCVKCESCACNKHQINVRDTCIPKGFINIRPKYEEKDLHPSEMLNILKHEYLCTQNNSRSCRTLANECAKNFYNAHPAGPCRMWIQPKLEKPKDLPRLTLNTEERTDPIELKSYGKNILILATAIYTFNGGFKFLQDIENKVNPCQLPLTLKIGEDKTYDCSLNITDLRKTELNETLAAFLQINGEFKPLPVILRKPDGHKVEKEKWSSDKFRRYFIVHNFLSMNTNTTQTVYLRTLLIRLRLQRNKHRNGSLKLYVDIEAQFSTKVSTSDTVVTSVKIENELPSAEIMKGLEISSGILGALTLLYALVQWRSVVRRGGPYISVIPLICGATADALYFTAWFTTLHALAAEAGTLGMTLPLSTKEEYVIKAFVFSAFGLKVIKFLWINWKQCQLDIFFIDWTENTSWNDSPNIKRDMWRITTLLREWSAMQSKRIVSPWFTVTLALLVFHFMSSWFSDIPLSLIYKWAIVTIAWWLAYTIILLSRWILDRLLGSPSVLFPKICQGVGLSLLVFEEEYYAHYQVSNILIYSVFNIIFKQISLFFIINSKQSLEGMSWVACERTLLERLLDIELASRESGFTSTLLFDNDSTPSCFVVTWWGQEWTLATFDALLLSLVVLTSGDVLVAALVTLVIWQLMAATRHWFGNRNITRKTNIRLD